MNKTLFVTGVPAMTGYDEVANAFSKYGEVESVRRIEDKRNDELCIMFVTMESPEAALLATKGITKVGGVELYVQEAKPRKPAHRPGQGYNSYHRSERPRVARWRESEK